MPGIARLRFGVPTVIVAGGVFFAPALGFAADVTFSKDVAPIFQAKCQVCHHPGTNAPMSLMTFESSRPWARSIKAKVAARAMPPWHLDKNIGITKFKDDRSISDEQIATIVAWVDAGAPQGDPKDLPAPRVFQDVDQWFIGQPDLIVKLPTVHVQTATGSDWWKDYVAETGLTEDRYIKATQTRPSKGALQNVHHAVASLINDPQNDPTGTFVSEYALGKPGEWFPEGTGRLMKSGSQINFNMHYYSNGEEVRDQTEIGFVFYPKGYVPKYHINDITMNEYATLAIPPDSVKRVDAYFRLDKPTRVTAFQPHMHMRGKAQCLEAILPSGAVEILNCTDRFDFNWHIMYTYADDVAPLLPANTMLHLISVFDNTKKNPKNPDPTVWVGRGGRSIDEMAAAHIGLVYLTDEDFAAQVAERQATARNQNLTQQQQ